MNDLSYHLSMDAPAKPKLATALHQASKVKNMNEQLFTLYTTPNGSISIEAIVKDESIWLTQKLMAELFGVEENTITYHIKEVYKSLELEEDATTRKIRVVRMEGKRQVQRDIQYFNLDMIISVGYRVNSSKATHFRKWATQILKEYIIKGFAMDDERLKQGKPTFNQDYFKELLERVRSIRASERRIWQQITDIFAECSIDYNNSDQCTHDFYASVQNKFHFAITGHTAPEIINEKADRTHPSMGLTTWKHAPDGRILKQDVTIAKNYLDEKQIRQLERAVTGYFDYIEDLIERGNSFTMQEFASSINEFLTFRKYKILMDKGHISKKQADQKARDEYDAFNKTQYIESDFDRLVKKTQNSEL